MAPRSHTEVERKFDVPAGTPIPASDHLPGVAGVDPPVEHLLEAVYYDTPGLALHGARVTLRRRTGGDDEGWHLKLPVSGDEREEVRAPLGDVQDTVPQSLLDRVRVHVRDRPVVPVATVSTTRTLRRLRGEGGEVLAELCDDRVTGRRLLPEPETTEWREWEAELCDGQVSLLEDVSELLLRAGAAPAKAKSKLGRTLAQGPAPARQGPTAAEGTAGAVLLDFLGHQLVALTTNDPLVRAGAPDAVHQMRVAARRSRSVLVTYGPLLAKGAGTHLRDELRWLGLALGEARDAEVLQGRLDSLLEELPESLMRGLVRRRVTFELQSRYEAGISDARKALDGARYFRLLDELEELLASPPLRKRAGRPAEKELVRLLERDWDRLLRRLHALEGHPAGAQRDRALHDVRKAAKRLRYAAQSAAPVLGHRADELASACIAIQDALGEQHDSAVARALLDQLRADSDADTGSHPLFDHLRAAEEERANVAERDFEAALHALPRKHLGTWLHEG